MNKQCIINELSYIERCYDFSDEMTPECRDYLIDNNLIELDKDTNLVFITIQGEPFLGTSKEELQEKYGDNEFNEEGDEYDQF